MFPSAGYDAFVDLTAGGGSVPLNALFPAGMRVVVNDVDSQLMMMWRCIQAHGGELVKRLHRLDYSSATFHAQRELADRDNGRSGVIIAAAVIARSRMSRGGTGKSFAKSNRLRGGQMGDKNAWDNAVNDDIPRAIQVVAGWKLSCLTYSSVLLSEASPRTIFFADPPYPHDTRTSTNVYKHEWSHLDHVTFLNQVLGTRGKFFVCSYPNTLYSSALKGWTAHEFTISNHSSQQKIKKKKTEVLWESPG